MFRSRSESVVGLVTGVVSVVLIAVLASPALAEGDSERTTFATKIPDRAVQAAKENPEDFGWKKLFGSIEIGVEPGEEWREEGDSRDVQFVAVRIEDGEPKDGVVSHSKEMMPDQHGPQRMPDQHGPQRAKDERESKELGDMKGNPMLVEPSRKFISKLGSSMSEKNTKPGDAWGQHDAWTPGESWGPGDDWVPSERGRKRLKSSEADMILVYAAFEDEELNSEAQIRPAGIVLEERDAEKRRKKIDE